MCDRRSHIFFLYEIEYHMGLVIRQQNVDPFRIAALKLFISVLQDGITVYLPCKNA